MVGKFVCGESIQKVSNSLKETYEFLELHLMKILKKNYMIVNVIFGRNAGGQPEIFVLTKKIQIFFLD